jgi:anti-sigma factor ChrR (cupin superfamily)
MVLEKHLHPDTEWVYILQGSFRDERGSYKKGDFLINPKNSKHQVSVGAKGCEILCCWCGKIVPLKK